MRLKRRSVVWLVAAFMALALPVVSAAQGENGRITGVITDESGLVVPGATVTAKGAVTRTAVTDSTGHFAVTDLPPGPYEVTIELSGFARQVSKVDVAAGQSVSVETKLLVAAQSESVQVTGTLIPRPTLEAMSPVTTLEVEELTYRGINRVEDLLQALPQVFAAQNSTIANGASGTATVDLRYVGPQRTLVLIGGRRLMPGDASPGGSSGASIAADLNFIPSALVKRVDVLTGGASSVYGADAVAGVVNFVMDTDFTGVRGGFQNAGYQHNNRNALAQNINKAAGFTFPSGSQWNSAPTDFNLALGGKFAERQGHASVYVDYRDTPAIRKDARDYTNCSVLGGMTLTGPTCGGSSTWQDGRFQVFPAAGGASKIYVLDVNSPNGDQLRPRTAADVYNYAPSNYMQRPDKRWVGGGFLNYQFNRRAQGYGEIMIMDDNTDAQIAPSGDFNNSSLINCDNPMLSAQQRQLLCTDMGYGPHDMANVYVARRNIEGGGRVNKIEHTAIRLSFGMKGDLSKNWNYDLYGLHGQVHSPQSYQNDLNAANIQDALIVDGNPNDPSTWHCRSGNAGCVPWNVFKKGGVTQGALDYLRLPLILDSGTRTRLVSGRIAGDLKNYGVAFPSAVEGIKIAVGSEYREEHLFVNPDLAYRQALGAGQGGPTLPVDGTYDVREIFGETLIPLVQEARGAKDLSLELGYRLSDYSSTGSHPTYKVQASYAPLNDLKFRIGYNRATRSPNVVELFTPQGLGLGGSADLCAGTSPSATREQCVRLGVPASAYGTVSENPANQYNTIGGGNTRLNPETANTYTGGVVFQPSRMPGFTAAIDYYNIQIDSTIGSLGADDIQNQCAATGDPLLCGLVHRDRALTLWLTPDAYTITTNQNIGKRRSEGLDFNVNYSRPLGNLGLFSLNMIGTYLRKQGIDTGLFEYDCVGYFGNQCGVPTPSWRHLSRFSWETKFKTTFSVGWRMVGGVTNDDGSPNAALGDPGNIDLLKANDIFKIAARHYIDLGASWKMNRNYLLIAGVNNLFDKEPPLGAGMSDNDYGPGFYGTYDPLGRYLHWGLQFTF